MSEWYPCPKCGVEHENMCACPSPSIAMPTDEQPFTNDEIMDGIVEVYEEWRSLIARKEHLASTRLPDLEIALNQLADQLKVTRPYAEREL